MEKSGMVSFPEYISSCCEEKLNELLLTGIDGDVEVIRGTTALDCKILWEDPEDHNLVEGQFVYSGKVHFKAEDEEGFTHIKVMPLSCKLTVWAYFSDDGIEISIDRLGKYAKWPFSKHDIILDHYLVPKLKFEGISALCDGFTAQYFPKEYAEKVCIPPSTFAQALGLQIVKLNLPDRKDLYSLLTNEETVFLAWNKLRCFFYREVISPDTIVLNTAIGNHDFIEANCIAHECFHYLAHHKFVILQQQAAQAGIHIEPTSKQKASQKQSLLWMEKQAQLGAHFLRYPMSFACADHEAFRASYNTVEAREVKNSHEAPHRLNNGEKYEIIISQIQNERMFPTSLIRRALIFAGATAAKGAYNYVNKEYIPAYGFDTTSCKGQFTYTISFPELTSIVMSNRTLCEALANNNLVYAEGHVCINSTKYVNPIPYDCLVSRRSGNYTLTEYGRGHVDECCLRFIQQFSPWHNTAYDSRFLTCDTDQLYHNIKVSELLNDKAKLNELFHRQAKEFREMELYFGDAIRTLRKERKLSQDELSARSGISRDYISDVENRKITSFGAATVLRLAMALGSDSLETEELLKKARIYSQGSTNQDYALRYITNHISYVTLDNIGTVLAAYADADNVQTVNNDK